VKKEILKEKNKELEKKMEELSPDIPHSLQVQKLSFSIFDQMREYHQLDDEARFLLGGACLLHDLGLSKSAIKHHKISQQMIKKIEFHYLDKYEKELIALISRYHRKAHPQARHKSFIRLEDKDKNMVSRLSAIIRIADGLDRSHTSAVESIKVEKKGGGFRFILKGKISETDLYGFNKKKDLFEEVFGGKVEAIWES
jgi:exopolyphosphatase/guanosine-5'-triphosphate,3'-diphosphate pyrophosphatase